MSHENVDLARAGYDDFNSGNIDGMLAVRDGKVVRLENKPADQAGWAAAWG